MRLTTLDTVQLNLFNHSYMIKFWITGHCKAEQKVKRGDTAGRAGSSC